MTAEEKKKAREEKRAEKREKHKGIINEFKQFISRGSVVDLAVGVVIGSAFSAIVTALTNIFLAVCTWGIPGGLDGLVTCLPAANSAQAGLDGIGQYFSTLQLEAMTVIYANNSGASEIINANSTGFMDYQTSLLSSYTLHGDIYYYNGANLIDWGTFLNAIITFFIIAIVLFLVVKGINAFHKRAEEMKKEQLELYYQKHPEERPAPAEPEAPKPTELDLLIQIRDELKKQNEAKAAEAAAVEEKK